MLAKLLSSASTDPRTTFAGLLGFLSLVAGMLATYHGGAWWPAIVGIALKGACDAVAHALAADSSKGAS